MAVCRPFPNQLQGRKFLIKIGMAIIILYAIRGRDIPDYYGRRKITMPTQHNKIPIERLLESYESALTELGYSITSKLLFVKRAGLIIRRHQDKGLVYFNQAIVNQYICEIDESYFKGGMQKKYYDRLRGEVDRFVCYVQSGKGGALPSPLRGAKQKLTPGFERIAEEFIAGDFHPNTRCDIRWVTYKYFGWLEEHGFIDLSGVSAAQIQRFLLDCSEHYAPSTIHDIRLYLKKLYAFLYETGLADDSYSALFSFVVNREKRVFPVLPKSDIAKLLDAIDRTKVKGKRDYAIMLLGTVLGLRACDIVTLKLTDIDWLHGEIRIMQSKTSNPVILPLTQDVGEALKDYILNARPDTADSEIFLRINAPHTRLAAAVTVGEIYRDCCIAAGLPASKRFHNLRRALGTSMVANGVSVYDVVQVFGDRNINSTKPYLATDMEHLKMCALSFEGIDQTGGAAE